MINALSKGSRLRLLPNLLAMMVAVMGVLAVGASAAAGAAGAGPWWQVMSGSRPTDFAPGGEGTISWFRVSMWVMRMRGRSRSATLVL